jgi:ribosomal protein L11
LLKTNNTNFLTPTDVLKIAFLKKIDFPKLSLIGLSSMILGTAKSMKVSIKK